MPARIETMRSLEGFQRQTVLQTDGSYGINNPLEMRLQQAPNAGIEAKRIWEKGMFSEEPLLSTERPATVEEAVRNSFAFIQVSAKKAGVDQVASISTGMAWDRQSRMEETAEDIVKGIAGEDAFLVAFGPHKLVAFKRGPVEPHDVLQHLVDVPREPYKRNFGHLADAQNKIQDLRQQEIIEDPQGTGADFIAAFNGTQKPLERAYKDNGKLSFQWTYAKYGNQLWAIDLDNQPMSMTTLALGSPDTETREMLLAIQKFLAGDKTADSEDLMVVEFDFSNTVSCCNISFNAQYDWERDAKNAVSGPEYDEKVLQVGEKVTLLYPNGERYVACTKCQEAHCKCTDKPNEENSSDGD